MNSYACEDCMIREIEDYQDADSDEPYWNDLTEITEDQVLSLIEEWEQLEGDIC